MREIKTVHFNNHIHLGKHTAAIFKTGDLFTITPISRDFISVHVIGDETYFIPMSNVMYIIYKDLTSYGS